MADLCPHCGRDRLPVPVVSREPIRFVCPEGHVSAEHDPELDHVVTAAVLLDGGLEVGL